MNALVTAGAGLRHLLDLPGCQVLPGVYDALTAKLAEAAGFEGLYLTGSGISYTQLARPDLGYIGLRDVLDRAWAITGSVSLPVLADADTGFGGPVHVANTTRDYERAGLAGIQIEDQVTPKRCGHYSGHRLISAPDMVAKIHAAVDARRDSAFVVVARTDARSAFGLDEVLRRASAFQAAGADVIFADALTTPSEMEAFTSILTVPAMANIVEGGRTPLMNAARLAELGYRLAIFPNSVARAAAFGVAGVLAELKATGGTAGYASRMFDFDELSAMVGLQETLELERRYESATESADATPRATAPSTSEG